MLSQKAIVSLSSANQDRKLTFTGNRDIHQTVPDHRVGLTTDGWKQVKRTSLEPRRTRLTNPLQAEEAGQKLRSLLRPSDTLHFFTSPYRRTRETTEGILAALTTNTPAPSPFPRHTIKVYEEPRLREQDFGNFQPGSAEMSRMWQERADYGHFFYRIPNGESAADAYDRVSGFNEKLWRSFGDDGFASVCVLVTHGLMTRVFLMKWYHFSVEYFEDLRNVDHCEFVVLKLNDSGKYDLQNQLRTWSELKRERANSRAGVEPGSPIPKRKQWGGCHKGDSGDDFLNRQQMRRRNSAKMFGDDGAEVEALENADRDVKKSSSKAEGDYPRGRDGVPNSQVIDESSQTDGANVRIPCPKAIRRIIPPRQRDMMAIGRDGGGSHSGAASRSDSEDSETEGIEHMKSSPLRSSMAMAINGDLDGEAKVKDRVRADALGDQSDVEDEEENAKAAKSRGRNGVGSAQGLWEDLDRPVPIAPKIEDNI